MVLYYIKYTKKLYSVGLYAITKCMYPSSHKMAAETQTINLRVIHAMWWMHLAPWQKEKLKLLALCIL